MPSFKTLFSVASVAAVAAALPAQMSQITARDVDNFEALLRRDATDPNPLAGFPSCEGKSNDPSYAPKSQYKDGQGTMLSQRDDKCGKFNDSECWTDYFLVGTTAKYNDWVMGPNGINCDSTTSCISRVDTVSQNCTTVEFSTTETVSTGIKAELEGLGVEFGASVASTQSKSTQACHSATYSQTCTWNDKNCHSIWTATQKITVHGYMRRSCKKPQSKNIQMINSPKRPDGFYSHGMADFSADIPGPTIYNCDGGCDGKAPGPLPTVDGSLKPFAV